MNTLLISHYRTTLLRKKYHVYDAYYNKYERKFVSEIMTIKTSNYSDDIKIISNKNEIGSNLIIEKNKHMVQLFNDIFRCTVYKFIRIAFFRNHFYKKRIKLAFSENGFYDTNGSIICEKINNNYKIYYRDINRNTAISIFISMYPFLR